MTEQILWYNKYCTPTGIKYHDCMLQVMCPVLTNQSALFNCAKELGTVGRPRGIHLFLRVGHFGIKSRCHEEKNISFNWCKIILQRQNYLLTDFGFFTCNLRKALPSTYWANYWYVQTHLYETSVFFSSSLFSPFQYSWQ